MTNTIRKHIWPVPLVASIVIIGALAAFLVLLNNPGAAMAQDPGEPMPSGDPCASMTDDERADHLLGGGTCATPEPPPTPDPNRAPTLTGTPLPDVLLPIERWSNPIDVSVAFTDPDEDDKLTYSATSDKTYIATVSIYVGNLLAIDGVGAGSAIITVTATDGDGATVSTTMKVEVEDHASQPEMFGLEGLDNGARLNWRQPKLRARGASVIGYRIDRDAWNSERDNPINRHGDDTIDLLNLPSVLAADYNDRGLAYDTVYSYTVRAIVEYDVKHWWNNLLPAVTEIKFTEKNYDSLNDIEKAAVHRSYDLQAGKYPVSKADAWWDSLNCAQRNDAVSPEDGEPPVGSDDLDANPRSLYCHMYDELSPAAVEVVDRAHWNSHFRYAFGAGTWSQSITTGASGGLLDALLAPPSAPRDVSADHSCDDQIMVTWKAPVDNGKVPANAPGCPTCPTNQTPKHIGGDSAGIEVQPGTAVITAYIVERKIGDGLWETLASNVTGLSYVDDSADVQYGMTYHYRVKAVNNADLAGPAGMVRIYLDEPDAPAIPDDLKVNLEPNLKASELQWTPPERGSDGLWRTEADFAEAKANGDFRSTNLSYRVERRIGVDGDWETILDQRDDDGNLKDGVYPSGGTYYMRHLYSRDGLGTRNEQEFLDAEPLRGTSIFYRVSALVDGCNPSLWREASEVEIPPAVAPGTPSDLTATAMSQSQIDLSWTASSEDGGSDITGYTFEYSTDDGSTWSDPAATDSMTTHSHTGLTAGTTYHYRVAAMNEIGSSMTSETAMATTTAVPGTPSDLTATAMSQSQIDLSWTASSEDGGSDITGYTFEYSTDDGSTWSDPAATDSMTTHSHTGLTAGTTYHYRVAAMNEIGSSMTSETAMATTTAVPGTPSDLTATAMSQSQIDLSWTASSEDGGSDITGYTFEYSTDDGSTWSDPAATDSMSTHSHTGLTAGTTYHYRVAAINEVGSSMTSEIAMATTAAAPIPSAPTITGVSSDAAGSATIMLTPGTNATVHYVWAAPVDGSEGMWSGDAGGNATSVTMTGLTSGQDYWFIAIAGNGADPTRWSGWSGWTANPQSIQ